MKSNIPKEGICEWAFHNQSTTCHFVRQNNHFSRQLPSNTFPPWKGHSLTQSFLGGNSTHFPLKRPLLSTTQQFLGQGSTHLLKNTTQWFPRVKTISWRDILIFEEWMFILILLPWMKAIYDENKNEKKVWAHVFPFKNRSSQLLCPHHFL